MDFCLFFSLFFFLSQKIDYDFWEGFGPDFCLFVLVDLLLQWEVCKLNPFQNYSERGYWYINWEYLEDSGSASCSVRIEFSGKSSFMRDFRGKIRIEKTSLCLTVSGILKVVLGKVGRCRDVFFLIGKVVVN